MMSAILPLSDGSRFRVLSAGDGPPVLLIHGVGLRAEVWGPQIEALSPAIAYESTLEPHQQRWLLALDAPGALGPEFALSGTLTATSREPLSQRQRFAQRLH